MEDRQEDKEDGEEAKDRTATTTRAGLGGHRRVAGLHHQQQLMLLAEGGGEGKSGAVSRGRTGEVPVTITVLQQWWRQVGRWGTE